MTAAEIAAIKADMEAGTPGPWYYRPHKFDDWGTVRGDIDSSGWMPFICQAHDPMADESGFDEHRKAGADPWAANARRIARVPAMEAEILRGIEVKSQLLALANELSWSFKTRDIAGRIVAALASDAP